MKLVRRALSVLREQWPYLLGASALGGVAWFAIANRPGAIGGGAGAPPLPEPPGPPLRWIELEAPYRLFTGDLYRACLDIPFGVGFLATPARIVEGAEKMGFRGVRVTEAIPQGWPGANDCDRFVEATWALEDKIVEGSPRIKKAWRRSRA